jgi:hypothetical protein
MNQKFFQPLSLIVLTTLIIGSLMGTLIYSPTIQAVDASTNQGVNEHILVNRIPQTANRSIEVNVSFDLVIIIDNIADQTVYDVSFNQSVPSDESGNRFEIVESSNTTSNHTSWVSYMYDEILPGKRELFNLTLRGLGNQSSTVVGIDSLNVSYLYSEFRIPAHRQSDLDNLNNPGSINFEITNSTADPVEIDPTKSGTLDINLIAPFLFIGVPLGIIVFVSFFWSKKNIRNPKKRV